MSPSLLKDELWGAGKRLRGVTVLELMVTLTVIILLAGLALPPFSSLLVRQELVAETNTLRGALSSVRQKAISVGHPVSICAGDPEGGCTGLWSLGEWVVFLDPDHDGDWEATDSVIYHGQVPDSVSVTANGPLRSALVYMAAGHSEWVSGGFGAGRLRVCVDDNIEPNARELVVSASGRVRLESRDFDGSCPAL